MAERVINGNGHRVSAKADVENRPASHAAPKPRHAPRAQAPPAKATSGRAPLGKLSQNVLNVGRESGTRTFKPLEQQKTLAAFAIHEDDAAVETKPVREVDDVHAEGVRGPLTTLNLNKDNYKESPMVLDVSSTAEEENKENSVQLVEEEEEEEAVSSESEYSRDIYVYLRQVEMARRPKVTYMKKQPDITHGMRSILVDWLVEVAEEYKLQPETIFLTVAYIDRFLSSMSVLRSKLQLVGTASMLVAAKFEEIYPPEIDEFVYITDDTYTKKQVLRMEQVILRVLTFDLAVPTIHYFLRRFCHVGQLTTRCKNLAMYLTELSLLEADPFLQFSPSVLAGSAICIACHALEIEPWNERLSHESGYEIKDFAECISHLYKSYCNAPKYPQQAVREKYRSNKYLSVADVVPPLTLPI